MAAGALLVSFAIYRWRMKRLAHEEPADIDVRVIESQLNGLTEVEAAVRLGEIDLAKIEQLEQRRFLFKALRKNIFTIFNFDLVGISILLYVLGSPVSALLSVIVFIIAFMLNVFQEVYTKKKLDRIVRTIRPQVSVIREGHIKSVDPRLVVEGDLLILRPGDHILVDGVIVGNGNITLEQVNQQGSRQVARLAGDKVRVNEYCVNGHTVYEAQEAGARLHPEIPGSQVQLLRPERTPLKRLVQTVMWSLLGTVILFSALLVIDAVYQQANLVSAEYRDAFAIIFGVAPTSLFLVLIVQYAMGTLRVANAGALVYESDTIESLANVSTVCFSLDSLKSGLQITLEAIPPPAGREQLSENLIRALLGDLLQSSSLQSHELRKLADYLPGTAYTPLEIAPDLSQYGWYGITFNEPDLRGTFLIGDPKIIEPNLIKEESRIREEAQKLVSDSRRSLRQWLGRLSHRRKQYAEKKATTSIETNEQATLKTDQEPLTRRKRLGAWLLGLLEPLEEKEASDLELEKPPGEETLILAYLPEPVPLFDHHNNAHIPDSLIPLSYLHISDTTRPEAKKVLQELVSEGIEAKILSSSPPEWVSAMADEIGMAEEHLHGITGAALESLNNEEYWKTVRETTIFGDLSPAQKAKIIRTLQAQGKFIAMVGHRTGDVPAMRQADLRIALKSGSQAAVMLTDIVLLEDSMRALPTILGMGQRLIGGVLDTFKLYLSQVFSQLLLIFYLLVFALDRFPYHPTQSGVINAFTIAIPNILLALWSAGGRRTEKNMKRQLAHFIIPTAISLSLLVWGVYALFSNRVPGASFPPQELVKSLKLTNPQPFYAELAVTYSLLFAGWLRVLFLQPPMPFWVGGAPLRGDRRVFGLVLASIGVYVLVMIFPLLPLQAWLRITWLPSLRDYLLVGGVAAIWAIVLRAIWRFRLKYINGNISSQP